VNVHIEAFYCPATRSTCIGAALAAVGVLLGAASPCAAQQQFGVGIHNRDSTAALVEKYVAPIGLSLRGDMAWKDLEPTPGQLQIAPGAQNIEKLLKAAAARGVKPVVPLAYGNPFYDKGDLIKSQEGYQAYIRYATAVVNELKGSVTQFEIWNEWNLNTSSKFKPRIWGDAGSYVKLLKNVYPALKAANHDVVIIGGAVGGTDDRWIDKFISEGGLAYVDGFSVHPYVFRHAKRPKAPVMVTPKPSAAPGGSDIQFVPGTPEEAISWIDELESRIKSASAGKTVPIYVTEVGWPTSTDGDGVSEDVAAAYIQRFMLLARSRSSIAGVWWYDLQDDDSDPSNVENRFGLLRQNGQPKPAYTALAALQHILHSPKQAKETDLAGATAQITITGQTDAGKNFVAAWLSTNDMSKSEKWDAYSKLSQSGYRAISGAASTGNISATPVVLVQQ
jgi:hypothetical protein